MGETKLYCTCKFVLRLMLIYLNFQVSDPLEQALKFLRPLQNLASNRIETHLLAYEVFIRKSMYGSVQCLFVGSLYSETRKV